MLSRLGLSNLLKLSNQYSNSNLKCDFFFFCKLWPVFVVLYQTRLLNIADCFTSCILSCHIMKAQVKPISDDLVAINVTVIQCAQCQSLNIFLLILLAILNVSKCCEKVLYWTVVHCIVGRMWWLLTTTSCRSFTLKTNERAAFQGKT